MRWTSRSQPPIQRLPVELLSYIFVLGTHSPPNHSASEQEPQEAPSFNADSVKTPLVFTAVNRHWRTVALNTPALWTSLCITVGSLDGVTDTETPRAPVLNTSHVTTYLSLSRNYPLDILIDARDVDWDFCEPEIPNLHDYIDYSPPFSPQTMVAVVSLLLPHLSHWRSIDILTDTWAPMYAALNTLSESLTTRGAPLLESLTLMRCNDFISHSPQFQPRHMRHPLFLKPRTASAVCTLIPGLLPRLRNLTLRGVHVCWSSLSRLSGTGSSSSSLLAIEFSSHCLDVRPSLDEFRAILSACPMLRKLVINGSGFALAKAKAKSKPGPMNRALVECEEPILLPHLQELCLGFRSTLDGRKILALLGAPNVRKLTLEDASHPGELDEVDANGVLKYVATGHAGDIGTQRPSRYAADLFSSLDKDAEHSRRGSTSSDASTIHPNEKLRTPTQQPFPLLETLTLKRVKVEPDSLNTFLVALVNIRFLVLDNVPFPMNMLYDSPSIVPHRIPLVASIPPRIIETQRSNATPSALTSSFASFTKSFCHPFLSGRSLDSTFSLSLLPCPKLEGLTIRNSHISPSDFEVFVRNLALEKKRGGWPNLHCVQCHLDSTNETMIADILSHHSMECLRGGLDSLIFLDRFTSSVEGDVAVLKVVVEASPCNPADEMQVKIVKSRPLNIMSEEEEDGDGAGSIQRETMRTTDLD
ncbi:hypothetical protein L218DRAFT_904971 [Marasmius fiardii PR-910]|nr:hypothetical protein L218DRAFT_904971 [Marasmius fiardii PR-910]